MVVVHLDDPSGRVVPDFESLFTVRARVKQLALGGPLDLVLDLTGARPDAERRRRLAEWLQVDAVPIRHRIRAFAIVAPSAFLRGSITAMRWFFPERMLHSEVFDTRAAALAWIGRPKKTT